VPTRLFEKEYTPALTNHKKENDDGETSEKPPKVRKKYL
jgi:hypothetical protein